MSRKRKESREGFEPPTADSESTVLTDYTTRTHKMLFFLSREGDPEKTRKRELFASSTTHVQPFVEVIPVSYD
jgi:hypothetical protein